MTTTQDSHQTVSDEGKELVMSNITNPTSIYIQGTFSFKGYKKIKLHCYVDTGASLCIASKHVIPPEHWVNAERSIPVKIADGKTITITKVCKNLDVIFAESVFHIPTVYLQESGIDFIIGNNFCLEYAPFTQHTNHVIFTHPIEGDVFVKKIRKAMRQGISGFLESMKKESKNTKTIEPVNISQNKIYFLERGRSMIKKFHEKQARILKIELESEKMSKIEILLDKVCSDNPLDPKKTKQWMKANIKLQDESSICRVKPMKYTPSDVEEFAVQIQELLDMKLIIPSKSPHRSPAFLVNNEAEKRRGKKRMVVNYKKMNDLTIGDGHNLPNKDELLARIRGKSIFSSFDCKSGFWQVLLDKDSQLLTAFTCPQGHYQWIVLPFGFKQAPSIFQRHMQNAFRSYEKFCFVYVDDIFIFSNDIDSHMLHVSAVLKKCETLGIILSKKKAQLFRSKINFLGLEINEGTHYPQAHILEHIHAFPDIIEDKKQMQRFLGVLTYASDYIPKLAEIRAPLQAKLKKDVGWHWEEKDTLYMIKIKKKLVNFPKLYHPDIEDDLIIETDASQLYWGGVLKAKRKDTNKEYVCRFASGSFKSAEINYHSNEKEYLAVIRVIDKFSIYLTPVKFLVRTDNKNFSYFRRINITGSYKQGRLVHWQQWLNHYSFDVEHLEGSKNCLADFLTREYQKTEKQ